MTKQATVELLQKQLPGFYSVEQVIKMISEIDDVDDQAQAYNENQIEDLISKIEDAIDEKISRLDADDLVDLGSAEFELNGNEISLYSVDGNTSKIGRAHV